MQEREQLLEKIQELIDENEGDLPFVSLDDFFVGNNDEASIAPEQVDDGRPSLAEMYTQLKWIEGRPNVYSVLVSIHEDWEMSLNNREVWPAADMIHIYAMAPLSDAEKWVETLHCRIYEGWIYGMPLAAPSVPPGYNVYTLYWD